MTSTSTTYRHDYIPPLTGYKLLKALKDQQEYKCELYCKAQKNIPEPKQEPKKSEWTGVGPMGLLIDPRIIPFDTNTDNIDIITENIINHKCTNDKNSEFIENVRKNYPHIYERWYYWPKYKWQMDISRNKTTYKLHYPHLPPLPDRREPVDFKYKKLENIMEESIPANCREDYAPFNINFISPPHLSRFKPIYGVR